MIFFLLHLEYEYLVEVATAKGEELIHLGGKLFTKANNNLIVEKNVIANSLTDKFKTMIKVNNIAKVLEDNFNDPLWDTAFKGLCFMYWLHKSLPYLHLL